MNGRARKAAVAAALAMLGCVGAQPAHAMRTYVNYDSLVISAGPGEKNVLTVQPDPAQSAAFLIADLGATIEAGPGCTRLPGGKAATCAIAGEYAIPSLSLGLGDKGDVAKVDGSFFLFQVDGGDGNDRLDLVGGQIETRWQSPYTWIQLGGGDDTLTLGGSSSSQVEVYGGDGNDRIDAADGIGGSYYGDRGDDRITANGWVSGGDGADTLDGTGYAVSSYDGGAGDDTVSTSDGAWDTIDCGIGLDALTRDEFDEFSNCETVG